MVLVVKNLPASAGDVKDAGSIPGWGRSPGGGHGKPLQYPCLENSYGQEPGGLHSMDSQRVGHDWMTEHTGMPDYKLLEAECVSFFSITGNTGDRKGFMLDTR